MRLDLSSTFYLLWPSQPPSAHASRADNVSADRLDLPRPDQRHTWRIVMLKKRQPARSLRAATTSVPRGPRAVPKGQCRQKQGSQRLEQQALRSYRPPGDHTDRPHLAEERSFTARYDEAQKLLKMPSAPSRVSSRSGPHDSCASVSKVPDPGETVAIITTHLAISIA